MAYSSNVPPVKEIRIHSIQGQVRHLWHNATFLMMLNGEVQVQIDDHATYLNDNGILLVEPDVPFDVTGHGSNLLMIIRMDYDFFAQGKAGRFGTLVCNSAEDGQRDYTLLRQLLSHLALNYFDDGECKKLRLQELCYSLLYYLNTTHFVPGNPTLCGDKDQTLRAQRILSYIESNYMQDIRLDDLSDSTYLSTSYLSRLFKKITGTNFKAYLEEVRLRHAEEDMRSTDQTITAISYNNGFPNVSALSSAIRKKYDMSPNELRRALMETPPPPAKMPAYREVEYQPAVRENLAMLAGPEPIKSAGIYRFPDQMEYTVEDVTRFRPIQPIWKQMINLGSLTGLSNVNTKSHLTLLQEEIGFKYARIENVLTEESIATLPHGQYNFSQFDRAIDLLLSLNLTPFLDLSAKGGSVQVARSEPLFRGDRLRLPSSEQGFYQKASALMRHCINTFGAGEVERWGVELCVFHDESLTLAETPEQYARRFQAVYQMIKGLVPNMLVGGPEIHIALGNDFILQAGKCLQKLGIKPDFLSLCVMPYEPAGGSNRGGMDFLLSAQPDYIKTRILSVRAMLREELGNEDMPIWATVMGSDIRTRNHVNDSAYQATFIVKNTLDLIGLVDVVGYWQLSDVDSEYVDTTRILFGGTGIISKDGLKKPGFSALKRLSSLTPLLVKQEGNMLVTTNAINTYNIVLYNYSHFNDLYCLSAGQSVTYDNVYTFFADAATRDIAITLNNLPNGRYKVITTTLNRENGSLFDEWLRYGIIDDLQPHDIRYLRDIVHPQRSVRYYDCQDGALSLTTQMLPHEVKFLLLLREL